MPNLLRLVNDESKRRSNLRGLLDLKFVPQPIPIEEVEPAKEIVKRFNTGRDVVWVDQQGSARDAGDRDEPARRQEQYGRRR